MSERERIEVWDCDCGIVNDVVDEECIVCEQPRQTIITPPPRDWKPVVGDKVLVEATLTHDKWHRDTVLIAVGDYMNIKVPLSNIRPLRKEGE